MDTDKTKDAAEALDVSAGSAEWCFQWDALFRSRRILRTGEKLRAGDAVWRCGGWCDIDPSDIGYEVGVATAILYGVNPSPTFGRRLNTKTTDAEATP